MASSTIQQPVTHTTLYSGSKWMSGSKTIDWKKYDYLILNCQTNSERPYFILPINGTGTYNYSFVLYDTAGTAGWLMSSLTITLSSSSSTNSMSVSITYNNANWQLGIIKLIGVKVN